MAKGTKIIRFGRVQFAVDKMRAELDFNEESLMRYLLAAKKSYASGYPLDEVLEEFSGQIRYYSGRVDGCIKNIATLYESFPEEVNALPLPALTIERVNWFEELKL